jgi:hypothetical protein
MRNCLSWRFLSAFPNVLDLINACFNLLAPNPWEPELADLALRERETLPDTGVPNADCGFNSFIVKRFFSPVAPMLRARDMSAL